ncbi:hypothetical protein GALMADRAFT_219154 [Galerina marginata CBS 339.88]|uniref:Uncharacterized protein n=1 Tax=Galerina marginata (strain CBS 339.88) TaxID=685588 RepID=A0A067U1K0_GALM3|nr:hypothetical protein GALMADRAFT_219154 [Galerina marginata CBS 339.88]
MSAGMFTGAQGVNISGGSFKVINGPYYHNQYTTHQHNVDSNNVRHNSYQDTYRDRSGVNYGGSPRPRGNHQEQHTAARPAPYPAKPARRHQVSEPYPATAPRPALRDRARTDSRIRSSLSQGLNLSASQSQVEDEAFAITETRDIQFMNPESSVHFENLFTSLGMPTPRQKVDEESDDEVEMEEPSRRNLGHDVHARTAEMRIPSPPAAGMAQLSIGDRSYGTRRPQAPSVDVTPISNYPSRATFGATFSSPQPSPPPQPVFSQPRHRRQHLNQQRYPAMLTSPEPSFSRPLQAAHDPLNHVQTSHTEGDAGGVNPSVHSQSFVNARSVQSYSYSASAPNVTSVDAASTPLHNASISSPPSASAPNSNLTSNPYSDSDADSGYGSSK